uniref:Uncharacterized protein n=1 Tax=Syphacia muris TaxID=451379 RepID=A0A0N5AG84_9BILA
MLFTCRVWSKIEEQVQRILIFEVNDIHSLFL